MSSAIIKKDELSYNFLYSQMGSHEKIKDNEVNKHIETLLQKGFIVNPFTNHNEEQITGWYEVIDPNYYSDHESESELSESSPELKEVKNKDNFVNTILNRFF